MKDAKRIGNSEIVLCQQAQGADDTQQKQGHPQPDQGGEPVFRTMRGFRQSGAMPQGQSPQQKLVYRTFIAPFALNRRHAFLLNRYVIHNTPQTEST